MHFLLNSLRHPQEVEVAVYFGMSGFKRHKAPQNLGTTMALGLEREMGSHGRVSFSQKRETPTKLSNVDFCLLVLSLGTSWRLCLLWVTGGPWGSSEHADVVWCLLPRRQRSLLSPWTAQSHQHWGLELTGEPAGLRWDAGSYTCTASSSGHGSLSWSWRIFQHCAVNWCKQTSDLTPACGFAGAIHPDELPVLFRSWRRLHSAIQGYLGSSWG